MTREPATSHDGPTVQEHIMITFGVVLTAAGATLFLLGSVGQLLRDVRHLRLPRRGTDAT